MTLNPCAVSRAARPLWTDSRWGILWILILLLGGGFGDRIVAQSPAPLRVGGATERDRTGNRYQVAAHSHLPTLRLPPGPPAETQPRVGLDQLETRARRH